MAWPSLILFLTGAGGLVLELVWTRALGLGIGLTVLIQVLGVGVFVSGYGIGAWSAGLLSKRGLTFKSISRIFGFLAFLASFFVYPFLRGYFYSKVGFCLPFLAVFMGSFFTGGVGPMVLAGNAPFGAHLRSGILLGANIIGSIAGSTIGAFLLIPKYGMNYASYVGSLCYFLAWIMLFFPFAYKDDRPNKEEFDREKTVPIVSSMFIAFVSGFAMLGAEALLFRLLVLRIGAFTISLAGVAAGFLTGLALGSIGFPMLRTNPRKKVTFLLILLSLGCAFMPVVFVYISKIQIIYNGSNYVFRIFFPFILSLIVSLPVSISAGAIIPELYASTVGKREVVSGAIILSSSFGSLAGPLWVLLFLIPSLKAENPFIFSGLILGAITLFGILTIPNRIRSGIVFFCMAVIFGVLCFPFETLSKRPVFLCTKVHNPQREIISSVCDSVILGTCVYDWGAHEKLLFTDGFQAASIGDEGGYMRILAHLPILLHPSPKRVVVVAVGSGTTLESTLLYDEIKRIDAVEISPAVITLTKYFAGPGHSPPDPEIEFRFRGRDARVFLHITDGRLYLKKLGFECEEDKKPDIITQEPLLPYTPHAIPFFTIEFYKIVKKALKRGGIFLQWLPLGSTPPWMIKVLMGTLKREFNFVSLWVFNSSGVLIASDKKYLPNRKRIEVAFKNKNIRNDLYKSCIGRPEDLLSGWICFLDDNKLGNVAPLTDEKPFLETFIKPNSNEILEWFPTTIGWILSLRAPDPPVFIPRKTYEAQGIFLKARMEEDIERKQRFFTGLMEDGKAIESYKKALFLDPFHRFAWFYLRKYKAQRFKLLAFSEFFQQQYTESLKLALKSVYIDPSDYVVHLLLAANYKALGRDGEEKAEIGLALSFWPDMVEHFDYISNIMPWIDIDKKYIKDLNVKAKKLFPYRPRENLFFDKDIEKLRYLVKAFPCDFIGAIIDGLDRRGPIREKVIKIVSETDDPLVKKKIAKIFKDLSAREKSSALKIVVNSSFFSKELWEEIIEKGDKPLRIALARDVLMMRSKEKFKILLKLMEDKDNIVREEAAVSMKRLIGSLYGYDPFGPLSLRRKALDLIKIRINELLKSGEKK